MTCNGGNTDPLQPSLPAEGADQRQHRIGPVRRDRQPAGNTGKDWANLYNTDPALRDRPLAPAHPDHLRGRRGARLRPPVPGARCSRSRSGWARPGTPSSRARPAPPPRRQLCCSGDRWDFAPVQDLSRDNRWGRYYETWGEEPALSGAIGAANITRHAGRVPDGAERRRDGQALRRLLGVDQRPRPRRGAAADPLSAGLFLPSYAGGDRRRRGHRDGQLRVDQRHPGDRLALPAHRPSCAQRLGFDGVVISDYDDVPALQTDLPHRPRSRGRRRRSGQRRRGHGDECHVDYVSWQTPR